MLETTAFLLAIPLAQNVLKVVTKFAVGSFTLTLEKIDANFRILGGSFGHS